MVMGVDNAWVKAWATTLTRDQKEPIVLTRNLNLQGEFIKQVTPFNLWDGNWYMSIRGWPRKRGIQKPASESAMYSGDRLWRADTNVQERDRVQTRRSIHVSIIFWGFRHTWSTWGFPGCGPVPTDEPKLLKEEHFLYNEREAKSTKRY